MNRRGFLGAILASCCAPAIVRAGILMPSRGIVIPTTAEVLAVNSTLLTPALIAREALEILRRNLEFTVASTRLDNWPERGTVTIRKPRRYSVSA